MDKNQANFHTLEQKLTFYNLKPVGGKGVDNIRAARKAIDYKKRNSYIEFLYILPFLLLVVAFAYFPLFGWIYSFYNYEPLKGPLFSQNYTGFKWFIDMFATKARAEEIGQVLKNTLAISGISLLFSWFPMVFAVFLNEVKCKAYRKFVQTSTTLPNFISWVLVYSVAFHLLYAEAGPLNQVLKALGVIEESINLMRDPSHMYIRMWLWLTWKNAGWAAIMYLAAIAAIDEQMIEAAKVDGATRMKIIWHITIPSLLPTYFVIITLNIANFLNNGMEQFYVFYNNFNEQYTQVLDLYVYNRAFPKSGTLGNFSQATAVSIMKSVVSILLLTTANLGSKLIRKESIF